MSVTYNGLHVDERYSAILEPNLYFNPILVPGVTCTDKYKTGPAGQIFVHQLNTSAVEAGTPGRDFTDEVAADTLIPIQINNNFQKSKKIYGVQAAAVSFAAGNEYLATAIQECREGWMQCGIACLAQEGKAATATAAITEDTVKSDLIDTRTEIVKDKGRANVVMCTPEYYGLVLKAAGKDFTPSTNDRIAATGNVGQWLGFTFVEANGATGSIKYYDHTGAQKTVDMSKVQYVMYYHETLSVVSNFEVARIIDSERERLLTAGYEFYRGTYHGDKITAAEWPVLSRDAAACLEELTLGRTAADLAPELLERCQMALCAVAEEYKAEREEGAGVVASESVGSWSRTYAQTASPAQKRRDAAWMWLGNTGLLYRGGESLCGRIP